MLINDKKDLSELKRAVNEIYRLNDALRIRISETDGEVSQTVTEYTEQDIPVLCFENKAELDAYAENYAKTPMNLYGNLCEVSIVTLPDKCGLLVKLHHIIGDAWTLALLGTQFNCLINGETPEAYSYTEYIDNESTYFQSKRYEKDRQFFLNQFKKCDEVTYLSEKQGKSLHACRKTFVIDSQDTKLINNYAFQKETSAFMLFTAALAVYMNRTKMNTENFYIGTAVINRNSIKEKNTAGMFINTVPMLMELDITKSFSDNLSGIEETAFSVFRHQKYNYGDVLTDIRKEYGFNEKLYDVILSYQNAKVIGGEAETTWYHSGEQSESLQIHIDDRDNEGIFRIHYDYQTEKFTEHEIDVLHQHICNLLFDAISNSGKKLYELNILTADEQQKLLYAFNDTAVDYPRDKCVHQLFEEQVEKTPDKTAVIACDKTLTYRELNEEANRIAHSLIEKGVGVGDIVAIKLYRKSYLFSAILGAIKCGTTYMPIDPTYPEDRIEYMMTESNAKCCIEEDDISKLLVSENKSNLNLAIDLRNTFCALHTSGSTGKPKMSLLTHGGMMNFISANQRFWNNIDTVVSATIVTFDAFVMESVLSVSQGKQVVLASEDEIYNHSKFESLFNHSEHNMFFSTPTKIENYIENSENKHYLSKIKSYVIGGEVFSEHLLNLIYKYSPNSNIYNVYGPTETTICALVDELNIGKDITIGKPIANTQIYIVDKYMKPTPIGVTGELCIAGDGVGVGYLNRPELTAEKFIDNPFGKGKLYKTGDLAYWREDGNIVYVGRNDFQVKIRGLRIELGEIENAICGIYGISQAVVVVCKNTEGRQLICAFYTGAEVDAKEIRSQIGNKLPKYMLPHIFTHLDEMPLTSSGKINRKALPEVDLYAIDTTAEYVAPENEQQKELCRLIESVLGCEKVGINDNFFDIGGDSLKAIELISKIEKRGYHTDIKTIFECDTVKELAEHLTLSETEKEVFDYLGDIPATDAQMRVYTAQSMKEHSAIYNVPYVFKVEKVDVDRLQTAVNKLINRHEILRTHFENKDGSIIQVINITANCTVEQIKGSLVQRKLDFAKQKTEGLSNETILPSAVTPQTPSFTQGGLNEAIRSFIRPFDLSKSPLLRVGVYENTVIIDMHHIITDGSSMPVFFKELNELYMGRELNNAPVQYKQFAVRKQDHTESEQYWLSVYDDEPPVLEINTDFKRGQKQSFNGSAVYDTVDIELHNKIIKFSKEHNITPYVFYMAGFNILLSKFSGNEDIVVGMPISGRDAKYLDTIGMFVNTIALRNKPVGTKTVTEFLQEVKENSIAAINHQDYSYGELVKKLNIITTDRNPLFDVMFAYQSEQMTDIVFGDKKAELLPIPATTAKYDFTFNVMPRENDVVIMAEYCTDLYKEETINRFIYGYKLILNQLLNSETALKDITAVFEPEQQKILYTFNDTAVDYPRDKCVHQLFEEQVEKTPDKVAVVFKNATFTYSGLNLMIQNYADKLVTMGIKENDVVAIHLERSHKLIAFQLAVLKIGAVFLPVDKRYPKDRIEYMYSDCNVKLLISDELNNNSFNATIISLDNFEQIRTEKSAETVNNLDVCYIIYTSGSTGDPKGCMITGQGLLNFCINNNTLETLNKHDSNIFACVNSVSFDYFIAESLLPLTNGYTTVVFDDNESTVQEQFLDVVVKNNINVVMTTPTRLNIYFDDKNNCEPLYCLTCICTSGEPLTPELLTQMYEKAPNAQIYNPIGPSECSVWDIGGKLNRNDGIDIHIGKPIANTQIYIVDKYMCPTPIGVTGELCIAGDGVGAGYLNRPELTAEKFIDNPFGKGKLYKTGDLAYWREDGNIVYVGRNDFQVKIRGLRIELGEIENAICDIDGISQAVVVVRKNTEGRQLICAFYTGAENDAKEIRSQIGNKLPKYMLPHIFTHLDEIPLTSSGKINRKALPEVDLYAIDTTAEYVAPENEQQKELCRLIESVLGCEKVGINDNFFDIGGDSLKAIEFVSEAHNEGIYFKLQNVFDYPTVKVLNECIENGDKQNFSFNDIDFNRVNRVLEKNKLEYITAPQKNDVGNILIAGATGFLGIHILADYLDNDSGTAYCFVRGKDKKDSINRLKELLEFYFGDKNIDMSRIEVVCADLQKNNFAISDGEYVELSKNVDTVINCAASVKHYGSYKYFYEVNVETVKRLIEFCKNSGAKLIHTSTLSISGNSFADEFDGYISKEEKHFYESSLYIGQPLENVYARSKFEAEKVVLDAISDGLQANIMRMGNLTNRFSDGQFQKNYESNAFLQRVKGILDLGKVPDYLMKDEFYSEFTPIDEAANAVMTITRHFNAEQTVFHINSIKVVPLKKLLEILNQLGYNIEIVNGAEFTELLRATAKSSGTQHIFETFINDMDENDQLNYESNIHIENAFTVERFKQIGFEWNEIDYEYIKKYVEYFRKIGFFGG